MVEDLATDSVGKNSGAVINVKGKLFGVPSPLQTSYLIQKLGLPFEKSVLNPTNTISKYKSDYQKALNLGIYGCDLGYVVFFEKHQESIAYIAASKKLADDLGIGSIFKKETMDRINKNISNKDSILSLASLAYRNGNTLLRSNQHESTTALILTGSFLEGLHIAGKLNQIKPSEELKVRIGQQKQSIHNIVELLSQYIDEPGFKELVANFSELKMAFEGINFNYTYEKPQTNAEEKTTLINSKTSVEITDNQINEIIKRTEKIRENIVNPI